jgi:hypothetical protein
MIFEPIDQKLILFVEKELELITFDMVAFPAMQRPTARLFTNELVMVQPMASPQPRGILFYFAPQVGAGYVNTVFTVSARSKGTEINGIIFYPIDKWSLKV